MESWSNLCRSCLSPETDVSLLNDEENIREQFLEITSVEVKQDDGLPHNLCNNCYSLMISAYEFRSQCIKIDKELKLQLEKQMEHQHSEMFSRIETQVKATSDMTIEDIAKESMRQLQSIIKDEPNDSDDDYYYVVVVDNSEDQNNKDDATSNKIKIEPITSGIENYENHEMEVDSQNNSVQFQTEINGEQFENNIESFLNPKVSMNVPDTILENEDIQNEEIQNEDNFDDNYMDVNNINQASQDQTLSIYEDSQEKPYSITVPGNIVSNLQNKQFIKILTPSGAERTILLKNDDTIKYMIDSNIVNEDSEEVIFYEGDESDLQILKCDGSELVIEYADDSNIATVIQQDDGTFLCECGEQFDDLDKYQTHQTKHHTVNEFLCNLCGKGFESSEILAGHMILHSSTGFYVTCPFCNQDIKRNSLTQHIKYTHNLKPQCQLCQKTFANQNNLKRHMMIHSGRKDFECEICHKKFHQKITMQTHRLTHVNPFTCYICGIKFENKLGLAAHKGSTNCHKLRRSKVKEELMKTVKQEIVTDSGKSLGFACSLCKKMFSVESALDQHVESKHLTDNDDSGGEAKLKKAAKRFDCLICGKGCASQAMLIMHERVHTNERPFPCQLCSLRFKTRTHLRTHQLTHTREKKFGCSVCMKFFALKGNLVVHLRTHTGERPYVCSLCNEAFIDSKYLKKHKQKKHAIENVPWNQYE